MMASTIYVASLQDDRAKGDYVVVWVWSFLDP